MISSIILNECTNISIAYGKNTIKRFLFSSKSHLINYKPVGINFLRVKMSRKIPTVLKKMINNL